MEQLVRELLQEVYQRKEGKIWITSQGRLLLEDDVDDGTKYYTSMF